MRRPSFASVAIALQTLRANLLHTFLSTLGIVIGVAGLVAILALGDGMEQFARDQIARTTDLQAVTVTSRTSERIDGVLVRRTDYPVLTAAQAHALDAHLAEQADATLTRRAAVELRLAADTTRTAAYLTTTLPISQALLDTEVAAGLFLQADDLDAQRRVLVLTDTLAQRLADGDPASLIGQHLIVAGQSAEIIGILAPSSMTAAPMVIAPLSTFTSVLNDPPTLIVRAHRVEDVPAVKEQVRAWLDAHVEGGSGGFAIISNEQRVEQARRGMLLFKLVMGLITGIAVIVGGIGVMNVLLMSVTERTREIGIRKAAGARRRDVVRQFLAEAIAVSSFGCLLGLIVGLITIFALAPVIQHLSEAPFQAAFRWHTVVIVALLAVVVGITFGTYPAWRAARLAPVDAIRHE